ncbi:MAG: hypothetical protein AB8F95_03950 [Bacteroidia bacterium]
MHNASLYQFLFDILTPNEVPATSKLLRQISHDSELPSPSKLEAFWIEEAKELPLQTDEDLTLFQWVVNSAFQYAQEFHREAFFHTFLETLDSRLPALKRLGNEDAWEGYIALAHAAVGRCLRQHSLEVFEAAIDEIDWDLYQGAFLRGISLLIGATYLEETDKGRALRARIWLQKSLQESQNEERIGAMLRMARYIYETGDSHQAVMLEDLTEQVQHLEIDANASNIHRAVITQLQLLTIHLECLNSEANTSQKSELQNQALAIHKDCEASPMFASAARKNILAKTFTLTENYAARGLDMATAAEEDALKAGYEHHAMYYRIDKLKIAADHSDDKIKEKDLKDLIVYLKREQDNIAYLKVSRLYAELLVTMEPKHRGKAHDILMDVVRRGIRKVEEGGFFLVAEGLRLANDLYLPEIGRPGVSWATPSMDEFFELITHTVDSIAGDLAFIGRTDADMFRNEYLRMEPASYMNIKVFFRYQYYAARMMVLAAHLAEDEVAIKQGELLTKRFADKKNPLNFILANWDGDFKDVAHDVRNKTINQCITISKGDLPLAAEHLDDFSYRNLRSYITFQEVHRLGYFMDIQETQNRQLEHAIRLLMHDLYENGTIFEVVFDVPKFLVEHGDGFFSEDMEKAMELKGTTAKKYINVMVNRGFLIKDKSKGRRHFFYLDRDKVMKRLAKDASTLIEPS